MEYNQYISPDGKVYNFDNQVDKFLVNISGTGMPQINPITSQLPFRHGEIRVGYRLAPRLIRVMHHSISGTTRGLMYSDRANLLDLVRPNRTSNETPGKLRKIFNDGSIRDLDVYFTGSLTLDETEDHMDMARWYVRDVLEFTAYDPIFYNPTINTKNMSIASTENDLVFPITFSISFSGNVVESTDTITYTGNWETSPIIEITGPCDSPTILNQTTGKKITVNYNIVEGDKLTINTDSYKPTVTNLAGTNLIGTISGDSNLIDFGLVPNPIASGGVNSIKIWGGAKYTAAQFAIKYKNRYIGY
jgi:hypothetical protein